MPHYAVSLLTSFRREKLKHKLDESERDERKAARSRLKVWADASFFDPEASDAVNDPAETHIALAGGSALIGKSNNNVRAIIINDLNGHGVDTPALAEQLNVIIVLEKMHEQGEQVGLLLSDAQRVVDPMKLILKIGRSAETGLNGHHERLVNAMALHPRMRVARVARRSERMPDAHVFAQCAAKSDMGRLRDVIDGRFETPPEIIFTGREKVDMQARFAAPPPGIVIVNDIEVAL